MSFEGTEHLFILLAAACANLAIGLYVFFPSPRERARQAFLLLVFGGFVWIAGLFALSVTHAFVFDTILNYGALLLVSGCLWFATQFPEPMTLPVRTWLLYAPMAIAAVAIIPEHGIVSGIIVRPGGGFTPILGPLLPVWSAILLGYALLTIGIFIRRYRMAHGHVRMQLRYLLLGIGLFLACGTFFDTILPALTGITSLNELGPLSSVVFVSCTAYAIVRHELLDIRVVIQRGLIYSVLLGLIVSLYAVVLSALGAFSGIASDDVTAFIAAVITTAAGISGAPIIERYFRRRTDWLFFKDRYDYADALELLSAILQTSLEFDDLVARSEAALQRILRASSVSIRVFPEPLPYPGPESPAAGMQRAPLSALITLEGMTIGSIEAGPKRSGDAYTSEDAHLLTTFANQAATAISRAHLYAQVKRHADELEKKVEERTEELHRTQERQRQMMLELSHNLQTPLAVLQTKIERLKQALIHDGEVRSVEQSLLTLSDFIYGFLELARLESSALPESEAVVDLSALTLDIAEEIGIIASTRSVTVRHELEPLVLVRGDARRLREALMNLASNALKYMRAEGAREISFSLVRENDHAILRVTDTGIGIETQDLGHIFDHFYRAKNRPYDIPGTGLGLAIVKRIVDQHGGTVEAASALGEGTTMTLSFPVL